MTLPPGFSFALKISERDRPTPALSVRSWDPSWFSFCLDFVDSQSPDSNLLALHQFACDLSFLSSVVTVAPIPAPTHTHIHLFTRLRCIASPP